MNDMLYVFEVSRDNNVTSTLSIFEVVDVTNWAGFTCSVSIGDEPQWPQSKMGGNIKKNVSN